MQRRVRIVVVNVVLCLLVLNVAKCFHGFVIEHRRNQGHAELAYSNYDCSHPDLCRNKDHNTSIVDANGHVFHFNLNALGFRGPDYPVTRTSPDIIRVALFGDSRMFGAGVDDGDEIATQLTLRLQEQFPGHRFEVMNFGMPGMMTNTHLAVYFAEGRQFEPDIAIFGYDDLMYRDMNYRLMEIRDSAVFKQMMDFSAGKWVINAWQVWRQDSTTSADLDRFFRKPLQKLAEDLRDRHLQVAFFRWWLGGANDEGEWSKELEELMPRDLAPTMIDGGINSDDYWRSPYCIPNDGHPTAAGHRYFSERLVEGIAPLVKASPRFHPATEPGARAEVPAGTP